MGIDAGITVSFYAKGKLVSKQYINCYKCKAVSREFPVADCDHIKVRFSTEYDSSSSDSSTSSEGEDNNSEADRLIDEVDFIDGK